MRLAGRTALVTGASRGIGAMVAQAYADEGAAVVLNYPPDDDMRRRASEKVDELRGAGATALAVEADVADRAAVAAMVATVGEAVGPIDVLVLNAAVSFRRPWTEITDDEWDRVIGVNLRGAFLCARAVHPEMQRRGYGKIISVTSVTVETGMSGFLHYVTSKGGLIAFTRALAREVGPDGICVNSVMPGAIRTEQELELHPDQTALSARLSEQQCLARRGTPADLAGAFVYLASAESDFVTGQVLNVDGGWVHY